MSFSYFVAGLMVAAFAAFIVYKVRASRAAKAEAEANPVPVPRKEPKFPRELQ